MRAHLAANLWQNLRRTVLAAAPCRPLLGDGRAFVDDKEA
jgi:hypothetical protein